MVIKAHLKAPVYLFTYTLNDIIAVEDLKSRQYLKTVKKKPKANYHKIKTCWNFIKKAVVVLFTSPVAY